MILRGGTVVDGAGRPRYRADVGEWERDYSLAGRSPSLLMPAADLVAAGDLRWGRPGELA